MEERGTRPRKSEEEEQLVQERRKRGHHFCTSLTQFTATEEIPEKNKATRFQNQSGRKTELVLRLKSYSRGLIRLNHENVKEGIAQCVEKTEKERVNTNCNDICTRKKSRSAYT